MHTKLEALAAEAHLTLALMHAQGVVYHLADAENRDLTYASIHAAACLFSGFSFLKHLRGNVEREGAGDKLREHYAKLEG